MKTNHYRLENCKRIAVIGGTFDPVHNGHLAVAEAVAAAFMPQKILFVPSGQPPHKSDRIISDAEHRYKMTLLATADNPLFDVSRAEIERPGRSFTVDTIKMLKEECRPDAEIYFIAGADAIDEILTWHNPIELLASCRFIAVNRPGVITERLKERIKILRENYSADISLLEIPAMAVSSSDIRARMSEGKPVRYLLPRPAEDYARRNNLYGVKTLSFEEIKKLIASRLSDKRFAHTMGVVESAVKLAERYGADVEKARMAALLHDCAKEYSEDKKRALCEIWDIPTDDILAKKISITHSLLGAESARRDFYITDNEILRAIRYHTTGFKDMTLMDKIIMLADFIEPTREYYDGLKEMRELAFTDLNAALRVGITETMRYNERKGLPVHPWGYDALASL